MKEESKVEELLEEFKNTFSNKHSSPQGDCIQIIDETIPYMRFHVWLGKALTEATENAKREGYERGHADALRTLPVYETDNTN